MGWQNESQQEEPWNPRLNQARVGTKASSSHAPDARQARTAGTEVFSRGVNELRREEVENKSGNRLERLDHGQQKEGNKTE